MDRLVLTPVSSETSFSTDSDIEIIDGNELTLSRSLMASRAKAKATAKAKRYPLVQQALPVPKAKATAQTRNPLVQQALILYDEVPVRLPILYVIEVDFEGTIYQTFGKQVWDKPTWMQFCEDLEMCSPEYAAECFEADKMLWNGAPSYFD